MVALNRSSTGNVRSMTISFSALRLPLSRAARRSRILLRLTCEVLAILSSLPPEPSAPRPGRGCGFPKNSIGERYIESLEQSFRLGVGSRCRDELDVHPAHVFNPVV